MDNSNFFFDPARLRELSERHSRDYRGGQPFPHIVIDNFLPPEVAEKLLAEFPTASNFPWHDYNDPRQLKLACEDETVMPAFTRQVLGQFNGSVFLDFLERLSGIEGLIADAHFRGGGLHMIKPGGFLKIHADFNWYPKLKLYRRLNALLFLNKDWKEEYGGEFELWDRPMKQCVKKAAPLFNRLVMFSTSDMSHHGHPDPLRCPPGMARKSLALYYYTRDVAPGDKEAAHSTVFQARPGEVIAAKKRSRFSLKRIFR